METTDESNTTESSTSELMLIDKWKNIRDAFNKSLKKTTGDSATKKYVYLDNLLFMLSIFKKITRNLAEDISLVAEGDGASEDTQTEEGELWQEPRNDKVMEDQRFQQRKKKAKILADADVDRSLIKALEESDPK